MKRILPLLCALLLLTTLFSACGKREEITEELPEAPEEIVEPEPEEPEYSVPVRPSLNEAAANNAAKDESEITLVQLDQPGAGDMLVTLTTSLGDVVIRVFPQYAPMGVENFTTLAQEGFYDDKAFYFVDEAAIYSGAVNANGTGSDSVFTDDDGNERLFGVESDWDLWHFRGAVSLVPDNLGRHGSQFMITVSQEIDGYTQVDLKNAGYPQVVIDAYERLGGNPYNDGYSTVIGMVVEGMDVVDAIAASETDIAGRPQTAVVIESVTQSTASGAVQDTEPAEGGEDAPEDQDAA